MNDSRDAWVPVARARRAHGVKGELRIEADGPDTLAILKPGVALRFVFRDETWRMFTLADRVRPIHDAILITLKEVSQREEIAELKGARIEVHRDLVPESEEPFFFELVGARVVDEDGAELGTLLTVGDNGAQELLVIESPEGEERLLPWTDESVRGYDRAGRTLTVRPIPGLWE